MASTPSFNWATPDNTGLVKNGALDIRTLGNAIDASMTDLLGGTTGQVLKKNSNTDMDFVWSADSAGMTNPMTTTGDTIYSSSGSTPARLGIGSTGQVLTVSGGVPTWATPSSGGGKVLQVVQDTAETGFTTTSSTYVDTGLSVSITPSSSSSKIMVIASMPSAYCRGNTTATSNYSFYSLRRGSTDLSEASIGYYQMAASSTADFYSATTISYLDSPATTSAVTYKIVSKKGDGNLVGYTASSTNIQSIVVMEIGA